MIRIFILLVVSHTLTFAQINDSFSDGDFTVNPEWIGSTNHFIINPDFELQLNAPAAGSSYLVTESQVSEEASWQIRVKMAFNPSSSNFCRIYLMSNNPIPDDATQAVYIELGGTNDNICLYKIESGTKELLIEGTVDRLDVSNVDVIVKTTRAGDDWQLSSNIGGTWLTEGETKASYNNASGYFGIYCKYTKTRVDKFFFDDISITGSSYSDKTPPEITAFNVINGQIIELVVSEAIDNKTLLTENFFLNSHKQHPETVEWNEQTNTITLTFSPALNDIENEELSISNIQDVNENTIDPVSFQFDYERIKLVASKLIDESRLHLQFSKPIPIDNFNLCNLTINNKEVSITNIQSDDNKLFVLSFNETLEEQINHTFNIANLIDERGDLLPEVLLTLSYYTPKRFDIVFNEWMADPTPSMGLPEGEFIELYNNVDQNISLAGWQLQVNTKTITLPEIEINNHGYLCLSSVKTEGWEDYPNVILLDSWPTISNDKSDIILYNASGQVIDATQYARNTIIGEGFKTDGGWSVERKDPTNLSDQTDNYHWSMELQGGTPGTPNSVDESYPDETAPLILHHEMTASNQLQISFNETMRFDNNLALQISPPELHYELKFDTIFLKTMAINFDKAPEINKLYKITELNVIDCAGHPLQLDEAIHFAIPDTLEQGDVLINEILFNPYPDCFDFVEIYNQSDKILNLSDIYLANIEDGAIEKLYQLSSNNQLLLPHSYIAVTEDKESLLNTYHSPGNILEITSLPSLPDSEGNVVISNLRGQILDQFDYSEKMHSELLKDKEGVSLERLSFNLSTLEKKNWHSAASSVGYATPGYLNSQQLKSTTESSGTITVHPEVFTPDGDGYDDWLTINYQTAEPANITIRIYDSMGRKVNYLINNQSINGKGFFTWDGLDQANQSLRPGIYIIYTQFIYESGNVEEEKLSCVIGTNKP